MKIVVYTATAYVLMLGLMAFKWAYYGEDYLGMVFSASSVLVAVSLFKLSRAIPHK